MLWLKFKIQSTIIPNEAPVMNEIKAPNIRSKLKIEIDQVGKVEKRLFDTSQLKLIEVPHWLHQIVARGRGIGIANLSIT